MEKLAIEGGRPVRASPWKVGFDIGSEEKEAVLAVLDDGWLSRFRGGKKVKEFEKNFADYCGVKYAVATTSGTSALHTAISAAPISPGDEVLVPALTFVSTASIILQQNAVPVFVDIDRDTFNISISDLERKITERTKAIIPVHLFGMPSNMFDLLDLAKKYNLTVIEDAAQAHGASICGKKVGSFGHFGCFSFFQTKNMTCGEGGMVLTNDEKFYHESRLSREHGSPESEKGWYFYDRLGFNYNMTELQAAIGLVQLKKLDKMNEKRKANAREYQQRLNGLGLEFAAELPGYHNVCHNFPMLLPKKFNGHRDWFVKAVSAEGVPIDICYPVPVYKTDLFSKKRAYRRGCHWSCQFYKGKVDYAQSKCPVAEDVSSRIVNVFTDPMLDSQLLEDICKSIKKVINSKNG